MVGAYTLPKIFNPASNPTCHVDLYREFFLSECNSDFHHRGIPIFPKN